MQHHQSVQKPILASVSALFACTAIGVLLPAEQGMARENDEIVVTARKQEENLQDVPIAIDVVLADEVDRLGINDVRRLVQLSSSLQFTTGFSANDPQVIIRGLRPTRGRVNAAVLLDGVDITSESIGTYGGTLLINPELYELERVEVVKGVQNALYGRSAFNGAISYITKKPTDEFDASVYLDVGTNGIFRTKGRVSGPLVEGVLAGGINALAYSRDGFYNNLPTGAEVGGSEGYAMSGDLVWTVSDTLQISSKLSYSDDESQVPPWRFMNPNTQFEIPAAAFADDSGTPGGAPAIVGPFFPDADAFGAASLGDLLGDPSLLDLQPGFVPGVAGFFPSGSQPGATMSPDPRTCTDPNDGSTCRDYEDSTREVLRAQVNVDWQIGELDFTSISHFADSNIEIFQDGNATGSAFELPFLSEIRYDNDTELFSQEFRLAQNDGEGLFDWTVGLLYWDQQVDQIDTGNTCFNILNTLAPTTGGVPAFAFPPAGLPPIPNTPCGPFQADIGPQGSFDSARETWFRDTEHWSAYFLVQFNLSDTWGLDLEGRYVDEEEKVGGPDADTVVDPLGLGYNSDLFGPNARPGCVAFPGAPGFPFNPFSCVNPRNPVGIIAAESDDSYFVPKATLTWTPAENQLYYFSVGQAAKPSGIAALTGGPGAFDPVANSFKREEKTTYELGAKTSWANNAVTVNGSVFFDDYKDKQITTQAPDPASGLLRPIADNASAEVFGVELEMAWQVADPLYITAGYTYLDTEYTDFEQITRSVGTIAYGGNCRRFVADTASGARSFCGVSFNGNQLEFAPEHAFTTSFRLDLPIEIAALGNQDWFFEGDASWTDDRFVDANNNLALEDFWLANFRLGVSADSWDIVAYVDNAFDDATPREGIENIDSRYVSFDGTPGSAGVLVPNGARFLLPDKRTAGLRLTYNFGG